MSKRKLSFIINPISGGKEKKKITQLIESKLSDDYETDIKLTEYPGHATELSKNALENNAAAIIAVGGDGTVNEVGQALIHTETPLGIIPTGSGDGFARHLNIPQKASSAIEKIKEFNIETIDTATINDIPFLATAGLGFDAKVGWEFDNFGKRGFLSYLQLTAIEFFKYKAQEYELIIDGRTIVTSAFLINFANAGQYGNNAWIAPSASVFDGKLNVGVLKPFPPHEVPFIIFQLFSKKIEHSKYYDLYQAKEIKIKSPKPFHIDGEPKENKEEEIIIKVVPQSLKVLI